MSTQQTVLTCIEKLLSCSIGLPKQKWSLPSRSDQSTTIPNRFLGIVRQVISTISRIEENADRKQLLRELLKGNAAPLPILSASVFSPHILLRGESDD